ncbi:hypothetical protein ANCCEY_12569 [Ancylostoma ceylanicum]|uniref:Myosin motor domain-containing protein n=1 Tax=Ancylostoma ceylanicum TaxID=53326 RepID=A0A0D6LAV3_9BILA|nr:hypothetical protein ANCCEY_12569 [Ancylostoma ceylanicum]
MDEEPRNVSMFERRKSVRALRLFNSSDVPDLIRSAVNNRTFSIRADCSVYSDLLFKTEIKIGDGEVFAQVISRFIVQRLFSDPKIMKNRKYAIGCGKLIVTDAGREALHAHFLLYTCWFLYFVETAKATSIIKHNPRMFAKNSAFKGADEERNLRRASLALADRQGGKFALGVVPERAAGEEIVLHVCKQIGYQLGIKNYLSSEEYTAERMRRVAAGASFSMAGDHSLMATYTVAPADAENSVFVDSPSVGESQPLELASQEGIENESVNRGDQLRRALSMLRDEIEAGKLRSIEERERHANEALFIHLTVKLQALARGFLARKRFRALLTEKKAEEKANIERRAATKIQVFLFSEMEDIANCPLFKAFRDYQLRKTKRNERHEMLAKVNKAVTAIQSLFRMRQAKKKVAKLREEKALEEKREFERKTAAAITIQSYMRMFIARKVLEKLKEEKAHSEAIREAAAIVIQTRWRGWIARCKLLEMQKERRLEEERRERDQAACTIQRYVRGMLARRRVAEMAAERQKFVRRVVVVQSRVRGFLARCRTRKMLAERERQRAENDAVFDDTQEHTPSTSAEDVIPDDVIPDSYLLEASSR